MSEHCETPRRTVLLAMSNPSNVGGPALRLHALHQALARFGPCTLLPIACNRWQECWRSCRVTGDARQDAGPEYFFGRGVCSHYADQLLDEFARDGVSTVVCSGLEAAGYVPPLADRGTGLTVVFDMHNVESALQPTIRDIAVPDGQQATVLDEEGLARTTAVEMAAVAAATEVWTCSEVDLEQVATRYDQPRKKIRVVPNVVEVPPASTTPTDRIRSACFTGRFDYAPNVDAAHTLAFQIAPLLQELGLPVPVVIAGAWARRAFAGRPVPRNVRLVSNPEDIRRVIAGSMMTVPLRVGSGSRFKILEAFALDAPVISTRLGTEGLAVAAGQHYLAAEEPADFTTAIDRLLSDAGLRTSLAQEARRLVEERYSVEALVRVLAAFFDAESCSER